jgi:hypothetical protein
VTQLSVRASTTGKGAERNTRSLEMEGGGECYAVGERKQDEGNESIENYSDCER